MEQTDIIDRGLLHELKIQERVIEDALIRARDNKQLHVAAKLDAALEEVKTCVRRLESRLACAI